MRTFLAVSVASAAVLAPLALTTPASAAGTVCTTAKMPKFTKVLDAKPGAVGKVTKKHPYGAFTGRYAKKRYESELDFYYWTPAGAKKTVLFAKNAQICVLYTSKVGGVAMKRVGLKGLKQAVDKHPMNPQWGLQFNSKGRVTVAYQIYMP